MKVIEPSKISGEIMDLIDTAKGVVVIVSPYNEITGWNKLIRKIRKAQLKGLRIEWYSRKDVIEKYPDEIWHNFKIKPILLENLQAKVYLNDNSAVVTSMNLSKTSDENSTDIGIRTTTPDEYAEVLNFYETYIRSTTNNEISASDDGLPTIRKEQYSGVTSLREISDRFHIKGIYYFLRKKYCNDNYGIPIKISNDNEKQDDSITFIIINGSEQASLEFTTYTTSIKLNLRLSDDSKCRQFTEYGIRALKEKLACKELEIYEIGRSLKYYYKSNFKIKNWNQARMDIYLHNLEILLSAFFPKK